MLMITAKLLALIPPAWTSLVFLAPPFPGLFGRQALMPGVLFALWTAVAAVLLAVLPASQLPLALAGSGLALVLARGRVRSILINGRHPPGSLAFSTGVRALARRDFYQREFSRHGPIFTTTQFGAPVICVSGLERICELLRSHADQLSPSPLAFSQSVQGSFLRYMDNTTHAFYGGLFRRAMAGPPAPEVKAQLSERAQRMLTRLASCYWFTPSEALQQFSREALNLLLFGFTDSDPISQRYTELSRDFGRSSLGSIVSRRERQQLHELTSLLADQARRLATESASGRPVLFRLHQLDAGMPDQVCLENLVFMHKIASNNVSSLLHWLLYNWGAYTDISKRIQLMPSGQRDQALDAFIAESLRLAQSEYLYRRVSTDFDFEGFIFPRGWMIRCCIWESHRTTQAIECPSDFRLRMNHCYDRNNYSPFGMDRHACNGVDINREICTAFLKCLAEGFNVELKHPKPFQRQMRHWSHWAPNHSMAVHLSPTS